MTLARDIARLCSTTAFANMSAFFEGNKHLGVYFISYLTLSVNHVAGLWDMNTLNSLRTAGSHCSCCGDVGTHAVAFGIKH